MSFEDMIAEASESRVPCRLTRAELEEITPDAEWDEEITVFHCRRSRASISAEDTRRRSSPEGRSWPDG